MRMPLFCWLLHCNTLQLGAAARIQFVLSLFLLSSNCLAVMLCMSGRFVMGFVTMLEQLLLDGLAACPCL